MRKSKGGGREALSQIQALVSRQAEAMPPPEEPLRLGGTVAAPNVLDTVQAEAVPALVRIAIFYTSDWSVRETRTCSCGCFGYFTYTP